MEDVLDLGEERRRGPATSVRTVAGAESGLGPEFGGRGGTAPRARLPAAPPAAGPSGRSGREPHCGGRRGGGGFVRPAPGPRWAPPGVRFL